MENKRRRSSLTAIPDTMTRSASCSPCSTSTCWVSRPLAELHVENVTRNAIKGLEVLGVADRIGVYPGHSCPMVAPLGHRTAVPRLRLVWTVPCCRSRRTPHRTSMRVDFIVDTVMSTDDVTLIATGPLTNIASAINREPRIVERVKELCIMGGSVTYGNWTPCRRIQLSSSTPGRHRACSTPVCTSR